MDKNNVLRVYPFVYFLAFITYSLILFIEKVAFNSHALIEHDHEGHGHSHSGKKENRSKIELKDKGENRNLNENHKKLKKKRQINIQKIKRKK